MLCRKDQNQIHKLLVQYKIYINAVNESIKNGAFPL
jgi:hypothetical protein